MSRRLAWQRRDDHVIQRAAAPAKKELVISRGLQTGQCDLQCRPGGWMHGRCGQWGIWGRNHTGTPLRGLLYSVGEPLMDSSSQISATRFARLLWLDHIFSPSEQATQSSQGHRRVNSMPGQEEGEDMHDITLI